MAEWKPEEHLQNADLNLNQYGDDSTPANQVSTPGGMNQKYTGENTLNSNIPYNANIKTGDLDPNYVYGWDAQLANSRDAGYIARRNDNIASALYNEGLRSKDDVVQFLGSQKNWNNSTEADRFNTVESVWKRIGDIAEQNDKDNTEIEVKEMEAEKKEEPKGKDVNVNTFLQGTTTELFGKMITGADTAPYDHNSNEWMKAEARLAQYQKINALTVPQLASSIKAGSILSGGQAMRDLQTYNPEKYQQLQEYQKKEDTMATVNMMASGNFTDTQQGLQDKTGESINNYLNETVANAGGDAVSRMDLDTALSQNQGLINYAERMSYYASQINQLDQTIGDLAEDARKRLSAKTGENVPEYMIQNYINNRSKKLYKQRDNLMNQYNYYKGVYEAQVEQEATAWERAYKERQMQLQEDKFAWDKKMDQAGLDYKYDQLNYDYYNLNQKYGMDDSTVQSGLNAYISSIQDKINNHGKIRQGRCGEPVNDYLGSLGINFRYDDKKSTKLNSITPGAGPKVGSIAIWDKTGTADGDKYGHVAIVTGVNKDGTITVLESNKNTGLRYHTYKQSGVTGYYDPSASSSKSSSKKSEVVYTNDELYTQLRGGKIKYADFLKKWNGNESQDQIDDRIASTYFKKSPMNVLSKMSDSVSNLNNMLGDIELAEIYTLEHLNKKDNIISERVAKIVSDYVIDTNRGLSDSKKINLSEYLAIALAGRYKSEKELKEALNKTKIDYKELTGKKTSQIAKEIRQEWNG